MTIQAYAAKSAKSAFEPFAYEPGPLKPDAVEIEVISCGICHSDLSMLDNEWGFTQYPFVGGHEVIGRIAGLGEHALGLKLGDTVGLGWFSRSCMHCDQCMSGYHNRCLTAEGVITHQYGGFADRVRCHWAWATKLPEPLDMQKAGPLFCGGITVFNPIVIHNIKPTDRVAVIGIGGLGHLAIQFLHHWGCEVTAFSTNPSKEKEARQMGAHHFVNTSHPDALKKLTGCFAMVLNTANAALDWNAYLDTLAPGGVLHTVGVTSNAFGASSVFPMIIGQKSLSASPLGPPALTRQMLEFCARHQIAPVCETYPMSKINDAFEKLRTGSPRYRLVLTRG